MKTALVVGMVAATGAIAGSANAGPPYTTDDPEPVDHRHWELYLASQHFRDSNGWSGTMPHIEVNYGAIRDLQMHLIAPLAYAAPNDAPAQYGFGDAELGIKFRFVHEGEWVPQIATFPFLEVPIGGRDRGLGNGSAQVFLPLWVQKSRGPWTTYGGGGVWFDLGSRHERWWYVGWQAQRRVTEVLTIGAELFHLTPRSASGDSDTRFNLGAVIDFDNTNHLLLSAGRSIVGATSFQGYVAYLVTLGPKQVEAR
jgi:hypothetical protein